MTALKCSSDSGELAAGSASSTRQATEEFRGKRALIVVAHADDAVLFASSLLPLFCEISLLRTTDEAPSLRRAHRSGFRRRLDYSAARSKEMDEALEAGGIDTERRSLPIRDGRACLSADRIINEVEALIQRFSPDVILTHAYEGGHRDHDTTAFATRAAAQHQGAVAQVWQMACYHARVGVMKVCTFPDGDAPGDILVQLSPIEIQRKAAMLDRFRTQHAAVRAFTSPIERFRRAAPCDFSQPPCPGPLGYESTSSGLESAVWRNLMACFLHADRGTWLRPLGVQALRAIMRVLIVSSELRLRYCASAASVERILARLLPA